MNKDYLAKRIAKRAIGGVNPRDFLVLPDESLLKLVKAAASDELILLTTEVVNKNEEVLQQLGMTTSQNFINLAFNNIGENMMSDDVLSKAVEILKEMEKT